MSVHDQGGERRYSNTGEHILFPTYNPGALSGVHARLAADGCKPPQLRR